VDQEAQDPL
jgi:hypothetical protein